MTGSELLTVDGFAAHARGNLEQAPDMKIFDPRRRPRRGDHDLNSDNDLSNLEPRPRPAAVLVPIVPRQTGLQVLLTLRSDHMPTHAGQIAFPGGKMEPQDATALDTALREAEEEIGLLRGLATPLGYLDSYQTGTGFRILPVVALIDPDMTLTVDPAEVADAFEVPLAFLMNPANHQRHSTEWRGATRHYYAMPWEDRYIWGATAGILRNMQETLF